MDILNQVRMRLHQGLKIAREGGELSARAAKLQMDLVSLQRERKDLLSKLGERYFAERNHGATEPIVGAIETLDARVKDTQEQLVAVRISARDTVRKNSLANPTIEMPVLEESNAELPSIHAEVGDKDGWPKA